MPDIKRGSGQTALITGASMGIGVDLAERFAEDGYDLILTARSADALQAVATRLASSFGITAVPIALDLGVPGGGAALARKIAEQGLRVDVLVNNAGFGSASSFAEAPLETQLGMVDLNIRALVELTHIYWKGMLASGRGGILNVASTAAFQPGPLMAVYFASKAFVLSLSEALWEEARGSGVTVSCLCPGATQSNFRARAGTSSKRLARVAKQMASAPVARAGYEGFQRNKRVVITGVRNALGARVVPFIPRARVLKLVRSLQSPV
jgi:short-subunit dehydrogenase